jgi:hypothetical protein
MVLLQQRSFDVTFLACCNVVQVLLDELFTLEAGPTKYAHRVTAPTRNSVMAIPNFEAAVVTGISARAGLESWPIDMCISEYNFCCHMPPLDFD